MKDHVKGFTLLEMVAVLIIIGVLSAIALPGAVTSVERCRGAEAREVLYKVYAGYQRFRDDGGSISSSDNTKWGQFGMTNPNSISARYFNYTFISAGSTAPTICRATRRGNATSYIQIALSTGAITNTSPY